MSEQQMFGAMENSRCGNGIVRWLLGLLLGAIAVLAIIYFVLFVSRKPHPREVYREATAIYYGMESFAEKFQSFPPNFYHERRFNRFVTRCFPQSMDKTSEVFARKLDAAESLVFWLSQISTDPRHPFSADATTERHEFFRFSPGRVRGGKYYPKHEGATDAYVYFC
jgi:hypothetical protein